MPFTRASMSRRSAMPLLAALLLSACSSPLPAPPWRSSGGTASARGWDQFKRQAAQRMVAASPRGSYTGAPPEILLAIPVLEITVNGDGSVRRINVLRQPSEASARDTTQLAIDAVRRAAPFGDVSHLPKPWVFTEAFLFDDQRRLKPRSLED